MNEQRKVIYKRRQQVLDGEDLRDAALEAIERAIGRQVDLHCEGDFAEEWNVEELLDRGEDLLPDARSRRNSSTTRRASEPLEQLLSTTPSRCTRRRKRTSARRPCATSSGG